MADEFKPIEGALRSEEAIATDEDAAGVQERMEAGLAERDAAAGEESAAKVDDEGEAAEANEEMQSAAPKVKKSPKA